jgi:predicted DNA-binding transcriptional regulator YafY
MPVIKNTLRRYVLIDALLQNGLKYSIKEIAEKVNSELQKDGYTTVSERMIYNDIKNINTEYPVTIVNHGFFYSYEERGQSINNEILRNEDKRVIEMALQTFSVYQGSVLFEKFDDIINRLLAGSIMRRLNDNDSAKYIQIGESVNRSGKEWIETIYNAIIEQKSLMIFYRSGSGEKKKRNISPYVLKEYKNVWYMLAHDKEITNRPGTNVFKLTRIEKIESSETPYFIDETFNSEDYFKYSLGIFHDHNNPPIDVKLKFFKNAISSVLEQWIHKTMNIESRTTNELIVTVKVYNTIELKNLILSYGANVEVISPKVLREEIKEILKESYNHY